MFAGPKAGMGAIAFTLTLFWVAMFQAVGKLLGYNVPAASLLIASLVVFAFMLGILGIFTSTPSEDS